jgi:apolipoprotein N-acyltransferase
MSFKPNNLLLSLLSGILLSAGWYGHLTVFVFFAFVPLLLIEQNLCSPATGRSRLKLLLYTYLSFLLWNLVTTWWIVYASFGGAVMAFIFNSLFMAMVFVLFSSIKNRFNNKPWTVWLLVPLWLAYEYGHSAWDLAWVWLTLGNVFAFNHQWVQWFEFTGSSGGTFWILCVNVLVFNTIKQHRFLKLLSAPILKIAAAIILPIVFSYFLLLSRKQAHKASVQYNVVVVQPNIDPYNVKFTLDYQTQFNKMLRMIDGSVNATTDYLVLPETFITDVSDEASLSYCEPIQLFRDSLLLKFPGLKIVVGADTYRIFDDVKNASSTARLDQRSGVYYDSYNTALQIDTSGVQWYHKSKLVPGVEQMPFPYLLRPLEKLAINMGGTFGSLGTQEERAVFCDAMKRCNVAPVICYESVFADYVTEYARKSADLIFIITNDGWWSDSPGHVQHLNYARLRAIENRKQIARSANTGISCFIDEFGNITNATPFWEEAVISKKMTANKELTFFSRYGDLLSYTMVVLALVIIILAIFVKVMSVKKVAI